MKKRCAAVVGRRPLCGCLALAAVGAAAQTAGAPASVVIDPPSSGVGQSYYLTPTLRTTLELTDNVNLSATNKQADLILAVTPGVRLGGQSGRVKGFLDFGLTASLSARGESSTRWFSALNGSVSAELVPNRAFIDANATISQQFINPFGALSPDQSLNNSNSTQVTTVTVAPRINGQIAGQVNYAGRAFYTYTDSGTSQASNSTVWGGLLGFNATTRWSKLSWGLDMSYREASFSNGRRDEFDQLNIFSLNYAVTPTLRVSARGNVETSNLASLDNQTTTGWGWGLRWNPSPRTNLVLQQDQRFFGSSYLASFDYRTPRTVWSISSVQGLSTGQFNGGRGFSGSAFDLLFAAFAQIEPDPIARAQLVYSFLEANGIDPNASLNTGYLPSQVTKERQDSASVALRGIRSTVIVNVYQTFRQGVFVASLNPDQDFANGNVIHWVGTGVTWSHRLSPRSSVTANLNYSQTSESLGTRDTNMWLARAIWNYQVAERATFSLAARRTVQSGTTEYTVNSLLATLFINF